MDPTRRKIAILIRQANEFLELAAEAAREGTPEAIREALQEAGERLERVRSASYCELEPTAPNGGEPTAPNGGEPTAPNGGES